MPHPNIAFSPRQMPHNGFRKPLLIRNPNIGLRLPILLLDAGFEQVQMNVVQPAGVEGEMKLINPITMDMIREVVLAEELASEREIEQITAQLYEFAYDPRTVASTARVVQTWGYRSVL